MKLIKTTWYRFRRWWNRYQELLELVGDLEADLIDAENRLDIYGGQIDHLNDKVQDAVDVEIAIENALENKVTKNLKDHLDGFDIANLLIDLLEAGKNSKRY